MLEGGEDPRFIARRMVILASEDVGNADPQALLVADAAAQAVDRVGLPECALNLAQAAVYLALAPKSNASTTRHLARPAPTSASTARRAAARLPPRRPLPGRREARPRRGLPLPARRARRRHRPAAGARRRSRGERFYEPTDRGFEAELRERLERLRELLGKRETSVSRRLRRSPDTLRRAQPFGEGRVLRDV